VWADAVWTEAPINAGASGAAPAAVAISRKVRRPKPESLEPASLAFVMVSSRSAGVVGPSIWAPSTLAKFRRSGKSAAQKLRTFCCFAHLATTVAPAPHFFFFANMGYSTDGLFYENLRQVLTYVR